MRITTVSGVGFGSAEDRLQLPSVRLPAPLSSGGFMGIHAPIKKPGGTVAPTPIHLGIPQRGWTRPLPNFERVVSRWRRTLEIYLPPNPQLGRYLSTLPLPGKGPVLKANGKKYVVPSTFSFNGQKSSPGPKVNTDHNNLWSATING